MKRNPIFLTDHYKYGHHKQLPSGTSNSFSYIEARGGIYPYTVFFGLQYFLQEYLSDPITMKDVDQAVKLFKNYGGYFNEVGFRTLVEKHNGIYPVKIKAVPEGAVVPTGHVLVTIEATDPEFYWVPSFLETALLRSVWYPTTVATQSRVIKQLISEYLDKSGSPETVATRLHDFGARGVSSHESAMLGGAAHLINFVGSDTVEATPFIWEYYSNGDEEFVPAWAPRAATEHSTVTSWGKENELLAYKNLLEEFSQPGAVIACVSDSYDIDEAIRIFGTELKQKIQTSGITLVIRPDSGHPASMALNVIERLEAFFGCKDNKKGYKVLPNCVRVIYGDGINYNSIKEILDTLTSKNFSADNIFFGMGGKLLQGVGRDDVSWAMKCSAILKGEEWFDVFKAPITDPGKKSKKGRITLVEYQGDFCTIREEQLQVLQESSEWKEVLEDVWENGELLRHQHFEEIRALAK